MKAFEIRGGRPLCGEISVQGAKNSALPVLAATLLVRGQCIIHNCPALSDVDAALKILVILGCVCVRDDCTVIVDATDAARFEIPEHMMHEMRSSIVFLGALVSRMGRAVMTGPGGCEIGKRPIDLHISSLRKLGVTVSEENGVLDCFAPDGIHGATVDLRFASVGATENVLLAAAVSDGRTVIYNAAKEPEISGLADFLNVCGAKISGAGSSEIIIDGVRSLHGAEYTVIPDRIAAATYLCAAAVTAGDVTVKNIIPSHLCAITSFFRQIGCRVVGERNSIRLIASSKLLPQSVITGVFPAFPTDAGSLIVPVMCRSQGISSLTETIFENRFRFVEELRRFGADITVDRQTAVIHGDIVFMPASAQCTDLRGGAALVLAALAADGTSVISEIHHIERGYCNLPGCLGTLGAQIKEVEKNE